MLPYSDSPKIWSPPPDQALSAVLAAVQVPITQFQIENWEEYLERLANRVEWMIQQEADLNQACRMIHRYLNEAHMDHQIWNLPDPEEDPQQWAEAITIHNPELRLRMSMRMTWDFPLVTIDNPEIIQRIQDTPLEVWLQHLTY